MFKYLFFDKKGENRFAFSTSILFWLGLLIKLLLALFFASPYLTELFAPFIKYFVFTGKDPYEYFQLNNGIGSEFPYPPAMLFFEGWPAFISQKLLNKELYNFGIIEGIIFRIPLLISDFIILAVLCRWLKNKNKQVLIWYWLSPITIYISYFHGQLDVIPLSFLILGLHYLFKQKYILSAILIGISVGCKTNMVLVLPFIFFYVIRNSNYNWNTILNWTLSLLCVVSIIFIPLIRNDYFVLMVLKNDKQNKLFELFYNYSDNIRFYFAPALLISLFIWYFSFKFVNRDQLLLFICFTFVALTLLITPMQGWYYWIVPFICYFVIKNFDREKFIYILLILLYFAYFTLTIDSDLWPLKHTYMSNIGIKLSPASVFNPDFILYKNIVFTFLQTTLLIIAAIIYLRGIKNNTQLKFLSKPFMIGISGDSAAGKSTLTQALLSIFGNSNTTLVRGDDMHKWERGDENWSKFTHLDPRANDLHQDAIDAKKLSQGKSIKRRYYDHSTGKFTLPKFIRANKLIVFEGLHSFYLKNNSNAYDLKIYLQPDENLRRFWKIKRDIAKRGYTPQQVLDQIETRTVDAEKYIHLQKNLADILVEFISTTEINPIEQHINPDYLLKITTYNYYNFDNLINLMRNYGININQTYENDHTILEIKGNIETAKISNIGKTFWPFLEGIDVYEESWESNYSGVLQLVLLEIIQSINDQQ